MSDLDHAMDEYLGLPPEQARELLAELEDHAAAAAAADATSAADPSDTGPSAEVVAAAMALTDPALLRQLAAPHAFGQISEQVLRVPRGAALLGLVLVFFGIYIVVAGDLLAAGAMAWWPWAAHGAGVGLLVCGTSVMLQRAWQTGPGVAVARLLQLSALLALGAEAALQMVRITPGSETVLQRFPLVLTGLPDIVTPQAVLAAVFVLAAGAVARWGGRALPLALSVVAASCVMYIEGPWPAQRFEYLVPDIPGLHPPLASPNPQYSDVQADSEGRLAVSQHIPHPSRLNILGRLAPEPGNQIRAPYGSHMRPLQLPRQLSGGALLLPAADRTLGARVLNGGLLACIIGSLAGLVSLLRHNVQPQARRALLLHGVLSGLAFSPFVAALCLLRPAGQSLVEIAALWWQRLFDLATTAPVCGWIALLLLGGCLFQPALYRLPGLRPGAAIRGQPLL
jgi:hypothetical protein